MKFSIIRSENKNGVALHSVCPQCKENPLFTHCDFNFDDSEQEPDNFADSLAIAIQGLIPVINNAIRSVCEDCKGLN